MHLLKAVLVGGAAYYASQVSSIDASPAAEARQAQATTQENEGSVPGSDGEIPPDPGRQMPVDGGKLYYDENGSGPALVLLHDGILHSAVWDAQVQEFAKSYRVIRYDRRGYGRSDAPTESYSNVEDLNALLAHLRVDQATLIGSSSGGGLAIDFTLAHPKLVNSLILVGAVVDGLGYSSHFVQREYANYSTDTEKLIEQWVSDRYLMALANEKARSRARELLQKNPHNLDYQKHRLLKNADRDALRSLSEIRVPTLLIVGAEDIPDVHAHMGAIEAGIVGSQRVVLPKAGHLPYMEQPEAFNRPALEFLSLIERRLNRAEDRRHFDSGFAPADGTALYYEMQGDGEPLVLIHGGGLDHRMWDDQFDVFAERARVVRYDARGHGLSKGPPGEHRDHEDLYRLLKHLGIARANILGLSLGGRIAVDFALEHPDMVIRLIPVSPGLSGYSFDKPELQAMFQCMRASILQADLDGAVECYQRPWTDGPQRSPGQVAPAVRERVRRIARYGIEPGRNLSAGQSPVPPAIERLKEIRNPTLVLIGGLDMPDILTIGDQLNEQIPGAKRVTFPNAAHMINMECPADFNRAVLRFLEER